MSLGRVGHLSQLRAGERGHELGLLLALKAEPEPKFIFSSLKAVWTEIKENNQVSLPSISVLRSLSSEGFFAMSVNAAVSSHLLVTAYTE